MVKGEGNWFFFLWRKCDTQTQNGTMNRFLYLEIVSFKIEEFFAVSDGDHYVGLGSDPVDIYIQQCQHLKEHTGIRLPWRPRYHQLVGRSVLAGGQRSPWWGWMHPAARLSRRTGSKPARASDFTINHCRVQENQPISVWVIKFQRWLSFCYFIWDWFRSSKCHPLFILFFSGG